ncbi:MAG: hypothetical protein C5B52_08650 [Bacteroidetes bacterium]|nr:MAG: hypothetical protein C5B52_08650 [Bacteroidota bacterium]
MKSSITIAFILLSIAISSCRRGHTILFSNDGNRLEISSSGEIKLSEDETTIQSISQMGYLKFIHNEDELYAEPKNGVIQYELYKHGNRLDPKTDDGKLFISSVVKDLIASGFDAKDRLARLYARGGTAAVIKEIPNLSMDNVKTMYVEFLMSNDSATDEKLISAANVIATQIGADYEKSKLLSDNVAAYTKDSVLTASWIKAVLSIGADYEKVKCFKGMLQENLNDNQILAVLKASKNLGADYDKTQILSTIMDNKSFAASHFQEILAYNGEFGADYDKLNMTKKLLSQRELPDGDAYADLLAFMDKLGSDMDKSTLLNTVLEKGPKNEDQWISLIKSSSKLSNGLDKSNMLVNISKKMPVSDKIKDAYMTAAKSLDNEMDYARAVKAVER